MRAPWNSRRKVADRRPLEVREARKGHGHAPRAEAAVEVDLARERRVDVRGHGRRERGPKGRDRAREAPRRGPDLGLRREARVLGDGLLDLLPVDLPVRREHEQVEGAGLCEDYGLGAGRERRVGPAAREPRVDGLLGRERRRVDEVLEGRALRL